LDIVLIVNEINDAIVRQTYPVQTIRGDFPILEMEVNGHPLVYLDNGATAQKPRAVIDAMEKYYSRQNANIHRGVYHLSQLATTLYEDARKTVQTFLNAKDSREVIFTSGTTDSINLVTHSLGISKLKAGDEIILSEMEHHSNIVPWQLLCEQTGATIRVCPVNDDGEIDLGQFRCLFNDRTKISAFVHVSNALGTINPVKEMVKIANEFGVITLVDGAQAVPHMKVDVQELGCDFYTFSGHKLYGPTGIGVLFGKAEILETMSPYKGGGDMIESVSFAGTTYAEAPARFEAGTPNIEGAVGLAAAIRYMEGIGYDVIGRHELDLLQYATSRFSKLPGIRIIGNAKNKAAVISFVMEDPIISALDAGLKLDQAGIAVRTGHHCCQPLMNRFHVPATIRASFGIYNTGEEIDHLIEALQKIQSEKSSPFPKPTTNAGWPSKFAESPSAAADLLAEDFLFFESQQEKNQYLLDLGDNLPHNFDMLKQITERVPGCMSEVYLVGRTDPENPSTLQFMADANADIVRGLIALLQKLYSGQTPKDILQFDIEGFFQRIELEQFVTSQRRNGLAGMVKRIRNLAGAL